jgi:hypothetical protein
MATNPFPKKVGYDWALGLRQMRWNYWESRRWRIPTLLEDNILTPQELNPIIMRLHVPGYEQARFYFGIAVSTGFVDRNMPDGYFLTEEIERIIGAMPSLKAKMGG